MMFSTPAFMRIFEQATPEAPTPLTTTFRFSIFSPVIFRAFRRAASTTIAVPCWSSWKTGMSSISFRRSSTSKQRRGGDVLEVDAAPRGRDRGDGADEDVGVLRVDADRVGVDPAELLEEHRLALHDRHAGGGADVAEPEHRGAVGDDGDHVALQGEVEGLAAVLGDRRAHAGDARHVGDREVVARLERHARGHLDLAALVHAEGAVERGQHLHAVEPPGGGHDRVGVLLVGGVHHQLADHRPVARPHQVDRADVAADRADRGRELAERVGLARVHLDAEGDAVLGARGDGHRCSLRAVRERGASIASASGPRSILRPCPTPPLRPRPGRSS